jgi:hypothetical protein
VTGIYTRYHLAIHDSHANVKWLDDHKTENYVYSQWSI